MPKAQRPWDDAEEEQLWELSLKYKTDYTAIAIELERLGWYRTPMAVQQKLKKIIRPSERKYIGIVDDIQKLAICKPWR